MRDGPVLWAVSWNKRESQMVCIDGANFAWIDDFLRWARERSAPVHCARDRKTAKYMISQRLQRSDAPWSELEVENLRRRQAADWIHPYTCGTSSDHGPLVPTRSGWVCMKCDYQQDWAHRSDVSGRLPPDPRPRRASVGERVE